MKLPSVAAFLGMTPNQHAAMAHKLEAEVIASDLTVLRADVEDLSQRQTTQLTAHGLRAMPDGPPKAPDGSPLPVPRRWEPSDLDRQRREVSERQAESQRGAEAQEDAQRRQAAWAKHREKIEQVQAEARRDAILSGRPTILGLMAEPGPVPPPEWHPDRRDGHQTFTTVSTDPDRNADGTRTISVDVDLLTGKRPGATAELTPEQQFAAKR